MKGQSVDSGRHPAARGGQGTAETVTVRIGGPINEEALHRALNELIRHHEIWRTVYPVEDGRPVRCVLPTHELELPTPSPQPSATASPTPTATSSP